jgi:hypothetical protein
MKPPFSFNQCYRINNAEKYLIGQQATLCASQKNEVNSTLVTENINSSYGAVT